MRGPLYLLSLLACLGAAALLASQGRPVLAVLAVVPGYLVVAYVLLLVSTFLPGAEKGRFEAARSAPAHPGADSTLPPDAPVFPAYLGSPFETLYSGDGFLAWPERGDLVFQSVTVPPSRCTLQVRTLGGFAVEPDAPTFLDEGSFITPGDGPVLRLDGGPGAAASLWVQPGDAAAFADRLRAAGVPELFADAPGQGESRA